MKPENLDKTIATGNLYESLKIIKKFKATSSERGSCIITLLNKEVTLLHELGLTRECYEISKKLIKDLNDNIELFSQYDPLIFYYHINSLIYVANLHESLYTLKKWQQSNLFQSLIKRSTVFEAVFSLCEATVNNYIDLECAEKAIQKTLDIAKSFKDQRVYTLALYRAGRIAAHKGEINDALEKLAQSLHYGEILGNRYIIASSLISIGEIFRLKGDFGKALQYYNDALIIHQMIGNKFGIANVYNNIGIVYYSKNDFKSAIAYFTKSIDYAKKVEFDYIIVESAYYLLRMLLYSNKNSEAKKYLELVEHINKYDEKDQFIEFYTLLCQAIYLRAENRFKTLSKAHEKLEFILQNNDIYHEINIHAMLNLCDLLIYELRITDKEEILIELDNLAEQLLRTAKTTLSRSLLAETYWLKSKLSLLKNKVDDALTYLSKAENIASKQDLTSLSYRIQADYRAIRAELSKWQKILQEDSTLAERIVHSALDELIKNMLQRASYELEEVEVDTPIMLIIVGDSGIPLYTHSFTDQTSTNDALFSGFITALNSILAEFFGTTGTLKRIEHQDYLLLFQNLEQIGFCYVYKGGTFAAKKKLKKFIDFVKRHYLKDLIYALETGKMIGMEKIRELDNYAKNIFLEIIT